MTMTSTRTRLGALAAVAVLALTACGDGSGGSGGGDTGTSSTSATSTPEVAVAGRQLTQEQLRHAVPSQDAIPAWSRVEGEPTTDPEQTAYPRVCDDLRFSGDTARAAMADRIGAYRATFLGQEEGEAIGIVVMTYPEPVGEEAFDAAGEALSQCGTYDRINESGTKTLTTSSVAIPAIGERSFGYRETVKDGDSHTDKVSFKIGHNFVQIVFTQTEGEFDEKVFTDLAEDVVSRLETLGAGGTPSS